MATITIRHLDGRLKSKLRIRAAMHGHSMEDEARGILHAALCTESMRTTSLAEAIRARMEPLGGVELILPGRAQTD
jgi:antitoxin FitA